MRRRVLRVIGGLPVGIARVVYQLRRTKFAKWRWLFCSLGLSIGVTFLLVYSIQRSLRLPTFFGKESSSYSSQATAADLPSLAEAWVDYDVHAFYYAWYGDTATDDGFVHWNRRYAIAPEDANLTTLVYRAPDDIGSSFYPLLGPYSSRDVRIVHCHLKQIKRAGIGVLAVMWYPPGMHKEEGGRSDQVLPLILDEAQKFHLKVCLHIPAFQGRDEQSMRKHLEYIVTRYGSHSALYRRPGRDGRLLPLYYVYDSYLTDEESWQRLLGSNSSDRLNVRDTELDGTFIGLLVDLGDAKGLYRAGFDGFYTHFAVDGFTFGSTPRNWKGLADLGSELNMTFAPTVAPGYAHARIPGHPWNPLDWRDRENGRYYERMFKMAIYSRAKMVTVNSFNEWHKGTQIEEAVPTTGHRSAYLDYLPGDPEHYLKLTRKWVAEFKGRKARQTGKDFTG